MLYPRHYSPHPAPTKNPVPQKTPSTPDPVSGASSHQPPNLFPLEPFNPLTSFLQQIALPSPSPTHSDLSNLDNLMMMETEEKTPEPQVTEPIEEEASSSIPFSTPNLPHMDQNRFFTLEDVPPSKWRSRLLEILAWAQVQLQKPMTTQSEIIAQIPPRL